jgi:predicted Zn-dependent protease
MPHHRHIPVCSARPWRGWIGMAWLAGTLAGVSVWAQEPSPVLGGPDPLDPAAVGGLSHVSLSESAAKRAAAFAQYYRGLQAARSRDVEAAIACYLKVLALDPGQIPLTKRLADTYVLAGRIDEARQLLEECQRRNPKNPDIYIHLSAFCAEHFGRTAEGQALSLAYAKQAVEQAPTHVIALQRLVGVLSLASQRAEAAVALEKAAARPNDDPEWWLALGRLARQVYRAGEGSDPAERSGVFFDRALQLAPQDAGLARRIADEFALLGRTVQAVPLYEKVVALRPDDLTSRQKLAHALGATQRPAEARGAWEDLLAIQPLHGPAHEALARLCEQAKDTAGALHHRAERLRLGDAPLRQHLQLATEMLADPAQLRPALTVLERAEFFHTGAIEVPRLAAQIHQRLGDFPAMLRAWDRATRLLEDAPSSVERDTFHFDHAVALVAAGREPEAEAAFRRSIESAPRRTPQRAARAYNSLAFLWVNRGQPLDAARPLIDRALAAEPHNPTFLDTLGWWQVKKGDIPAAITTLRQAVAGLTAPDPEVLAHLALALRAAGSPEEARTLITQAQALPHPPPWVMELSGQ